jgi:DNA-3-methyladenine glycosylase II
MSSPLPVGENCTIIQLKNYHTVQTIVHAPDIEHLLTIDPILASIRDRHGIPPNWSRPPGFISLSKLILEQQVSLASAAAHFAKLEAYVGDFTPENLLKLSDEEFRSCQISRQKTVYLKGLSEAIVNEKIDLEGLAQLDEPEIRAALTSLKGIGNWTADVYLMFCQQSKDIFPIGDIAVVNTIKELYDIHEREEMVAFSEKWAPYRSLAVYFLWHHYLEKRKR